MITTVSGYVYIASREHSTSGRVKIGSTNNIDRRRNAFNNETGADCEMIMEFAFAVPLGREASIERLAHSYARLFRHRSEWFNLTTEQATRFIHDACIASGVPFNPVWNQSEANLVALRTQQDDLAAQYNALLTTGPTYDPKPLDAAAVKAKSDAMAEFVAATTKRIEAHMAPNNQIWGYCTGAISAYAYYINMPKAPLAMTAFVALIAWGAARMVRLTMTNNAVEKATATLPLAEQQRLAAEADGRLIATKRQALAVHAARKTELANAMNNLADRIGEIECPAPQNYYEIDEKGRLIYCHVD